MRRIIHSTSVSICVQFALGPASLFAASNDFNSNSGSPGIFGAIIGVVVPTLLIIAIGGVIYVWLRRNKPFSTRPPFPRRRSHKNWDMSPPTRTSSPRSPMSSDDTPRFDSPDPLTEPDRQLGREAYTIESIALTRLAEVKSLRESNRIQEYYESISIIIKQYVGEKYQIKSLDATTGQILSALPNGLTDSVTDHVGEILLSCDMVHFSRHRPSRSEQDRIYQTAREFLESQIIVAPVETDDFDEEEVEENDEMYQHYRGRF